jgi:hypothetical protein
MEGCESTEYGHDIACNGWSRGGLINRGGCGGDDAKTVIKFMLDAPSFREALLGPFDHVPGLSSGGVIVLEEGTADVKWGYSVFGGMRNFESMYE